MTGRAQPNLTHTLAKLEAVEFVQMRVVARRKAPVAALHTLRVAIDPFSQNDHVEMV
jgi:predicted transcriptional regulator